MQELECLLLSNNNKEGWRRMAKSMITSQSDLKKLVDIFCGTDYKLILISGQCLSKIYDIDFVILKPFYKRIIDELNFIKSDAFKRNTMRFFQKSDITEEFVGILFDKSLILLSSPEEAIAIRAFASTVLRRICEKHPELAVEVIATLEMALLENKSTGFQNRGKKELEKLNKIKLSML